ncbi:MAG TPA: PKD domain-containing protein [Chitinophagaceae bacterium]|nr:PKD domain-containing protein [Chitinophagaceae bacterium]
MKQFITLLSSILIGYYTQAQAIYNSSYYAKTGDTVYMTAATPDTINFYAAGPGKTWNFSTLKGVSQQQIIFRNPKATGFTQFQWPYIYNTANTNLSSTNNQTINVGTIEETNYNNYYLLNNGALALKASSYSVAYNNIAINIKNVYTAADTLYRFPLHYTDSSASNGNYTTSIPGVYYNMQAVNRSNKVDGWGSVTTPYGTFSNCLRVTSTVIQTDTFSFYGIGLPAVTTEYRELKWLDTSKGYPVLYVKQDKTQAGYITESVQYLAAHEYYQPQALFGYIPLLPGVNDTITFQNLSANATSYTWDFGDGKTSTAINPQHAFSAAGKYPVQLIAYNGPYADTVVINITVTDQPQALFTYLPLLPAVNDTVTFQNLSINATSYKWNFGDGKISSSINPKHVYTNAGKYPVQLVAYNGIYTDTLVIAITVADGSLPVKLLSFTGSRIKEENILQWSTSEEINTNVFAVEKSTDGKSFIELARVNAAGNSNTTLQYSFTDVTATAGGAYYRLKMFDKDGKYSYSGIIAIDAGVLANTACKLLPNPVWQNDNAVLQVTATGDEKAVLYLVASDGRIMRIKNIQLFAGTNNISLQTTSLAAGAYFVNCINAGKQFIAHEKLIVSR